MPAGSWGSIDDLGVGGYLDKGVLVYIPTQSDKKALRMQFIGYPLLFNNH